MTVKAAWCTLMIIFSGVTLIEKLVERRKGKKGNCTFIMKNYNEKVIPIGSLDNSHQASN